MGTMRGRHIGEPIAVTSKQHGYFPKAFTWRGERHAVQHVEACSTTTRKHLFGTVQRHLFRVRTAEATYELSQDINRDTWQLERVVGSRRGSSR